MVRYGGFGPRSTLVCSILTRKNKACCSIIRESIMITAPRIPASTEKVAWPCKVECSSYAPLAGAHVRDVLHDVSHALLRVQLIGRPREDLQKRVEPPSRRRVAEDRIPQPVRQAALLQARVLRQGRLGMKCVQQAEQVNVGAYTYAPLSLKIRPSAM